MVSAVPMEMRRPVMICGSAEGSTTKRKICQRPAPIDWAARSASMRAGARTRLRIHHHDAERPTGRSAGSSTVSPMPNHRMNSGMSPSGGIGLTISDGTRNSASTSGNSAAQQADGDAERPSRQRRRCQPVQRLAPDMGPDTDARIAALNHVEEACQSPPPATAGWSAATAPLAVKRVQTMNIVSGDRIASAT